MTAVRAHRLAEQCEEDQAAVAAPLPSAPLTRKEEAQCALASRGAAAAAALALPNFAQLMPEQSSAAERRGLRGSACF